MSKYLIELSETPFGDVILDARDHCFYLFFNEDYSPDAKSVVYMRQKYANKIRYYVECNTFALSEDGVTFREGYGLKLDGVKASSDKYKTPVDINFTWDDIVGDFTRLIELSKQKKENYEKVILIWIYDVDNTLQSYNQLVKSKLNFEVCLRVKNAQNRYNYFKVPENKNIQKDFKPNHHDYFQPKWSDLVIVPYTPENYAQIVEDVEDRVKWNAATKKKWFHRQAEDR